MRVVTNRLGRRLSVVLIATLLLSSMGPLCAADKGASRSVVISSFTDLSKNVNINAGKAEGMVVGAKGIILRDGRQIADYEIMQVNWGFSRIQLTNLASGVTVGAGDSAPITYTPPAKKSKSKYLWAILAVVAAVVLLSTRRGGGKSSGSNGTIALTTERSSSSSNGVDTVSILITAKVSKSNGDAAPDGTAVTFSTTAGTLNRTQATTSAGRATATLSSDSTDPADVATVTVKSLGQTATLTISFVSSIDLEATPTTIQAKDSGGPTESTIKATCLDATGNPATSGNVTFTTTIGTVTDTVPITSGVATATFSSTTPGKATITASWSKSKATVLVTVTAGSPYAITVASNTSSVSCDGNSADRITASVTDVRGNPVTDRTVVHFSVIPDGSGGGNGTITSQVSTSDGNAAAFLVTRDSAGATSKSGTATVRVEVLTSDQPSGVPAPATNIANQSTQVQFISLVVGNIALNANPTNIRGWGVADNTSTITAAVSNADGNAIPDGTVVKFTATHGIISGTGTTSGGLATATLTGGGGWYGAVDVTATVGTVTVTQSGLVIFSGPADFTNSTANMPPTTLLAPVDGRFEITIVVRDVNNNPVADGTQVTVTTDKGTISGEVTKTKPTTGGNVVFVLATSTDPGLPTPTGSGTVNVSIATGGVPVTKILPFTVGP